MKELNKTLGEGKMNCGWVRFRMFAQDPELQAHFKELLAVEKCIDPALNAWGDVMEILGGHDTTLFSARTQEIHTLFSRTIKEFAEGTTVENERLFQDHSPSLHMRRSMMSSKSKWLECSSIMLLM